MSLEDSYSTLDRLVHRVAFSSRALQLTAADIGDSMYGKALAKIAIERPTFVTSLPRAGTTLVLELAHRIPGFSTHNYRDMPFPFAPMLWRLLSGGFRQEATLKERAHGDGMTVGFDSPEAFEEALWRLFWPERFHPDAIDLWPDDDDAEEFFEFFCSNMRKVISLRGNAEHPNARYVSKNNANIGRIGLLRRLFPDCIIVVPFRHPIDQASSLLRQHQRFLEVHEKEAFSRRYMENIGHLEFGQLHRPLSFAGMAEVRERYWPVTLDYWVAYWIAAFEHVLRYQDDVRWVSYEHLCGLGEDAAWQLLLRVVDAAPAVSLGTPDFQLKQPPSLRDSAVLEDEALRQRAEQLHERLLALRVDR
jgi:hypothetical protein